MVQRDERGGLGEAVTLDHDEAQPPPEFFRLGIERSAARNEGPELSSRTDYGFGGIATSALRSARPRGGKLTREPRLLSGHFHIAPNFVLQRFHQAWYSDDHRNELFLDDL